MKRSLIVVFALVALLCVSACGAAAPAPTAAPAETAAPAPAETAAPQTRVITDALGREVEIPAVVERITPLGNASRMLTYLGVSDRFVTITESDLSTTVYMAYGYYSNSAWADLPVAASGGYGQFNPEVIIEAAPDVILCTYEADIVSQLETQTGLPVVAVAQGELFAEDYEQALRIFGDVCGVSDRAEELISCINGCLSDLEARTAGIAEEDKPSVLAAAATFRGGHGIAGVYVKYSVLNTIAANDVTSETDRGSWGSGIEVDREQVLTWDPDYIVLDAGNMGLVNAEYAETPDFFAQLKAFQNGSVYKCPNSTANYTNVEIPLVSAYYLGSVLYPDAFADVDFEAKAAEIFKLFLGHDDYLQVLTDAGFGYGPVTLGE